MVEKECKTCVFNTKQKSCKALNVRIEKNCWAWADEEEYAKRKADIKRYEDYCNGTDTKRKMSKAAIEKRAKTRKENLQKRGGKAVAEVLDKCFDWYYSQEMTDEEIALKVHADRNRVTDYRSKRGLPAWTKKDRPALTGTA